MYDRQAFGREDARNLAQISRLVAWREVDKDIERPHGLDAAVLDAGQIAAGRAHVLDAVVIPKTLSTQLKWPLADINEYEARWLSTSDQRPAPGPISSTAAPAGIHLTSTS
jgi:hypothetical protein